MMHQPQCSSGFAAATLKQQLHSSAKVQKPKEQSHVSSLQKETSSIYVAHTEYKQIKRFALCGTAGP